MYRLYDPSFSHRRCRWWQLLNLVHCYDSPGGIGNVPVYRVFFLRLWHWPLVSLAFRQS